jgi:hypothetical protein
MKNNDVDASSSSSNKITHPRTDGRRRVCAMNENQQDRDEKKASTTDDLRAFSVSTASLTTGPTTNVRISPRQTSSSNNGTAFPAAAVAKGPPQQAIASNVFGTMAGVQPGGFNHSMMRGYPNPNNVLMTQYPSLAAFPQGFGLIGSKAIPSRKVAPNVMLNAESLARLAPAAAAAACANAGAQNYSTALNSISPKAEPLSSPSGRKRKADTTTVESDEKKNLLNLKPKRPLSAYNFFFQEERSRLLGVPPCTEEEKKRRKHRKSHGKIAFTELAKHIGLKWKDLDAESKAVYEHKQQEDRKRYQKELSLYDQMIKEVHGTVKESDETDAPREKVAKISNVKEEDKKVPPSKSTAAEGTNSILDQQGINVLAYNQNHQQMMHWWNMQKQQQQLAQLQAQFPFFPSGSASAMAPSSAMMQQQQRAAMDSRGQYERAVLAAMYENMVLSGQTPNGNAAGFGGMLSTMNGFFPSQGGSEVVADNRPAMLLTSGIPNFSNLNPSNIGAFPPNNHQAASGNPTLSALSASGINPNHFFSSLANGNPLGDLAATIRQQERQVLALQQQLQQQQQQNQTVGNAAMSNAGAVQPPAVNTNPGNQLHFPFNNSSINNTPLHPNSTDELAAASRQHQEHLQQMAALQQLQQQSQLGRISEQRFSNI